MAIIRKVKKKRKAIYLEPLKHALQLYIYCQFWMNNSEKAGCISAEAIKKGVYFTENSPFQFQE